MTGQAWVALSPASSWLLSLCSLWEFPCGFRESPPVALKSCQLLLPGIKSSRCWGWTPRSFYLGSCGWNVPSCEHLSSVIRRASWGSFQTASKQTVGPARLSSFFSYHLPHSEWSPKMTGSGFSPHAKDKTKGVLGPVQLQGHHQSPRH